MIKVYKINLGSSSTKKTLEWFDSHHIKYKSYPLLQMKESDLRHILELSSGFQEILRPLDQVIYDEIEENIDLEEISTTEMVKYILRNPYVLKTPIIFDEKRLLVGFNETEIRQFIPPVIRKLSSNDFFK